MPRRSGRWRGKVRRDRHGAGPARRRLVTIVGGLVLAAMVVKGVSGLPAVLSRLALFQVERVEFRGLEFLEADVALQVLDLAPGASVWDELGEWESTLRAHPLVEDAKVRRSLPHSLVVTIVENPPVALFPMTTLEPVDESGQVLPIDPTNRGLDLPILDPEIGGRPGEFLTPDQRRVLAAETSRLTALEPRFMAQVSQMTLGPDRQIVARMSEPQVDVLFTAPLPHRRLRQAMDALGDAMARFPEDQVRAVDLRFQEQVVVRLARTGRS